MLYLKHYSEVLFAWGETHKAIETCKIAANAYKLLQLYNHSFKNDQKLHKATKQDVYRNILAVINRKLEFDDLLLFSEYSLGYFTNENLKETKKNDYGTQQKLKLKFNVNLKWSLHWHKSCVKSVSQYEYGWLTPIH